MKRILYFSMLLLFSCVGTGEDSDGDKEVGITKSEINDNLDVLANEFEISPTRDTLLFGTEGTAIFIEANSLMFSDGTSPDSPIKIDLKEYYAMSDIVGQNLTTLSNGEMLETGGMINIKASSGGKKLSLQYGKDIIVHFPKSGNTNEMGLFSGRKTKDKQIVWDEEETSTEGYVRDDIHVWYTKYEGLDKKRLWLTDDRNIFDWIDDNMILTKEEQDYVMFKDLNLHYTVTKVGEVINFHFKKKVDKQFKNRMLGLVKDFPKCKPYTVKGDPIEMEGWFKFQVEVVPPSHQSNKGYLKTIEGKYPDFEKQSINDVSKVDLHYYIFNSAKLGWLNCDRFIDDPAPKVDMSIKLKQPEDLMIKMIYKEYKSVIPPRFEGKTHYFEGVPVNKDITIMIIRYGKKNVEMSITKQKTVAGEIKNFDFKAYKMGELKLELEKLN